MSSTRVLRFAVSIGLLALMVPWALPAPARATWVNTTVSPMQFQVGGKLAEIVPQIVSTAPGIDTSTTLVDPTCGTQGGTSLALVRGTKLANVSPIFYPIVLVVSCLDNGGSASVRSRLNFINPVTVTAPGTTVPAGTVVKQITTTIGGVVAAPSNGWAHLVHRPDKGDLLGCGSDGSLYSIDYSQTNSVTDGTATKLSTPAVSSCGGLAWDAENDTIYQGLSLNGNKIGSVVRFKEGATTVDASFSTSLSCPANGLAISGGVLLVSCAGLVNNTLAIQRLDKNTGASLGLYPSISLPVPGTTVAGFLGLTPLNSDPGLGDLTCDPATFQKDGTGRDLYRDAVWSRRGANGNGVAAVEFPAFTCGLPSNSVVIQNGVSFSPLAAGLSTGTSALPGQFPLATCFDTSGIVKDSDGDGLPDCWEANSGGSAGTGGIDFDGDGAKDLTLCALVDTNGDGIADTTECADSNHKDLFVQIGWMDQHKPDPLALSQTQLATSVGVKSVREAFAAAPVANTTADTTTGIKLHMQVDDQPVVFPNFTGTTTTSHVTSVALTPCTGPASSATNPADAADYDVIKALNFGTLAERSIADPVQRTKTLNAKRLAFRYVLFAHNLVGNPNGGSSSSGCSEVGGDDGVVSLGSFASTTVGGISHNRGTTDQQAGTFMHEFGHLLGFQHGGADNVNCKPNYRSVMSYSRQFAGSPITARRLDYSRSDDLDLSEASLNECSGIGTDPTLGPITPFFSSADQIAFGPGAWSVVTPATTSISASCTSTSNGFPINWNRQNVSGKTYQIPPTVVTADINAGSTAGCDGSGTTLFGSNDWANVLYRLSAAVDFAGGVRSQTPFPPGATSEMTKEDETAFFLAADSDGNGVGDAQDCGTAVAGQTTSPVDSTSTAVPVGLDPKTFGFAFSSGTGFLGPAPATLDAFSYAGTNSSGFTNVTAIDAAWPSGTRVLATLLCPLSQCGTLPDGTPFQCNTHRIDIKPSAPLPKTINLGTEAQVTIAIFSEPLVTDQAGVLRNWNAPAEIKVDAQSLAQHPLTFTIETVVENVKTNNNGSGTCSISDVADPITGQKDGLKDLKCQFPTTGLPAGTHIGVVNGFFLDPLTQQFTAFSARQEVTILP
jgi:hypothetical protein